MFCFSSSLDVGDPAHPPTCGDINFANSTPIHTQLTAIEVDPPLELAPAVPVVVSVSISLCNALRSMSTRVSPRLPPPPSHGSTNNAKINQNSSQNAHTPQTEGRMSRSRDNSTNAASRADKSQSTTSASRTSLAPPTNATSGRTSAAPSPTPATQNNPNSSVKGPSSKSVSTSEPSTDLRSPHQKSVEVFMDGSDLVTCTTQPLFYTDTNTGIAHLIRLVRIHTASSYKPSVSPSSFMPTASVTTSCTAAHTSASNSSSQSASQTYSSSEIYVRAGDLCMVFLHNKHSVSNFIRDFNQPYEKALLRVAKQVPRDAYCLTARGVRRFMQTKRIKAMSNFYQWISQCLYVMMRPGNENMTVPRMAIRPKNATDAPNPDAAPQQSTSRAKNRSAGPVAVTAASGSNSNNNTADDEPTVDLDTSGDADEAEEDRREALTRKLRFTYPSESALESWRAASLTSSQSLAREEDEKTARHVAENALATVAGRGHSVAGRNWAEGKGLFEGKQTRLGPRYQAVLQPMLSEKQQLADMGRWDDELISDPFNVTPRLPPLSSFHKIDPSDEQSRRLKRKKFDALQNEARRTRKDFSEGNDAERPARSPFEGAGTNDKGKGGKSADEIEANAWRKVMSTLMRRDLSRNDFEVSLMSMFIAPGALLRIFTHTMPRPHVYEEAFDVTAIENFLPTRRAEDAQRSDLAAEMEAAEAANGGPRKKRRMGGDDSSSASSQRNNSSSKSISASPPYHYNNRSAKSDSPPALSAFKGFDSEVDLPSLVPIRLRNSSSESSSSPVKAH